jgi:hypothetical protein
MDYFTSCYIPSLKKELKINKLTFGDYLQTNIYIDVSDHVATSQMFDVICEKSFKNLDNISNFDKFFVLIHLRNVFLNPLLKLSGKNEEKQMAVYEVVLKEVLQNCKKYEPNDINLPEKLYYKTSDEILKETSQNVEKIKTHISENKLLMFNVPDVIKGIPKIYINCFDNTLFYFCKLLYSTNLKNLYKKIIILKKHFNFSLSEIYDLSPKELDIFLQTK